jgi:hypothetical protein
MNEREFLELLNLYVDREISAEDALRLEAEVVANPRRRGIYDEYCKMQKACSMIAEERMVSVLGETDPTIVSFPYPRRWGFGRVFAGMAAAAAFAVVVVALRNHDRDFPAATIGSPVASVPVAAPAQDPMKPVFFARPPSDASSRLAQRDFVAAFDGPAQVAQLNWIGDVHMVPVLSATNPNLFLDPKADLKSAVLAEPQGGRDDEPADLAAFRFQR